MMEPMQVLMKYCDVIVHHAGAGVCAAAALAGTGPGQAQPAQLIS
mgnify:CR=1 FL=1